jgi:manganese/zinc/iron transport system substrate-binding protein
MTSMLCRWLVGGLLWLAFASVTLATGLTDAEERGSAANEPLRVVATTGMVADLARVVGGDRVAVTGLMGEGVDPHLYKASPGDVRLLTSAQVIFYSGLLLEGRMVDVLVKLANRKPTFAVTERFPADRLREPPEFHGHPDPHVWFDPRLWAMAVERVRDALIEVDPAGRATYEANAAAYAKELDTLHAWITAEVERIPPQQRILVTAHDAFGYLGAAYGIRVLGIQGISTDSEASLKDINGLVDLLVKERVPAVFVESSVPRKTIDALVEGCRSRGHEVRVGGELFSDALGKAGTPEGTYLGMVRHNVRTIVTGLTGASGPTGGADRKP